MSRVVLQKELIGNDSELGQVPGRETVLVQKDGETGDDRIAVGVRKYARGKSEAGHRRNDGIP
jgi:hypothetical protein